MEKKDKTTYEVKNIPPGKSGLLELVYFATSDGISTDILTLTTNDKANPRTAITVSAEVVATLQEKSPIMEEKSVAPFGN
jgi:hypothetical protein